MHAHTQSPPPPISLSFYGERPLCKLAKINDNACQSASGMLTLIAQNMAYYYATQTFITIIEQHAHHEEDPAHMYLDLLVVLKDIAKRNKHTPRPAVCRLRHPMQPCNADFPIDTALLPRATHNNKLGKPITESTHPELMQAVRDAAQQCLRISDVELTSCATFSAGVIDGANFAVADNVSVLHIPRHDPTRVDLRCGKILGIVVARVRLSDGQV